jgi:hypothetical protein
VQRVGEWTIAETRKSHIERINERKATSFYASVFFHHRRTVAPQSQSSTEYTFAFLLTRMGPTSIQLTLLGTFFPLGK